MIREKHRWERCLVQVTSRIEKEWGFVDCLDYLTLKQVRIRKSSRVSVDRKNVSKSKGVGADGNDVNVDDDVVMGMSNVKVQSCRQSEEKEHNKEKESDNYNRSNEPKMRSNNDDKDSTDAKFDREGVPAGPVTLVMGSVKLLIL